MKPAALIGLALLLLGSSLAVYEGGRSDSVECGADATSGKVLAGEIQAGPGDMAALRTQLEGAQALVADLEARNARLRAELGEAEDARVARERQFLRFTQGIAQLSAMATPSAMPRFAADVPGDRPMILDVPKSDIGIDHVASQPAANTSASPAATTAAVPSPPLPPLEFPQTERNRAIFRTLRMLLAAEQVTSLDLLESGNLHERSVGPVVLRMLDENGRPVGSIAAERLRLEASRAARMITIVLEQGYERHAGRKTAFEGGPVDADGRGGVRRIALPDCDPRPWLADLPELFDQNELVREIDDGRHDLGVLRATLNQLLHADSAAGWYRVQGIGGVQGIVLRDVALDRLDRDGKLEGRLFADRMSIVREKQGLQLSLEGGSQVRGSQKLPFLDGRYRIFLPRADIAAWMRARVPGLAPDEPAGVPAAEDSAPPAEKKTAEKP